MNFKYPAVVKKKKRRFHVHRPLFTEPVPDPRQQGRMIGIQLCVCGATRYAGDGHPIAGALGKWITKLTRGAHGTNRS